LHHFSFQSHRISLAGVEACRQLFEPILFQRSTELLLVALVDEKVQLIELLAFGGTRDRVDLVTSDIFRKAVLIKASGLILAHNHPSGDQRPSSSDRAVTRKMALRGEALDIVLIDHLVFNCEPVYSMRQHGYL